LSEAAPVAAQSRSFAPANGQMTFLATFSDRTTGIFDASSAATITPIAGTLSSAQGPAGATFASFGPPAINENGINAFRAILSAGTGVTSANEEGIWTDNSSGSSQLVTQTGAGPAPGTTVPFAALSDPVFNDNNDVAFVGTLKVGAGLATAATKSGVWSNESGRLALVARTGTQAPGCATGVTFAGFSEIALPDSNGVVMLATLNPNPALGVNGATDVGVWATDGSGNLDLIVRTGDVLNGKTVSKLAFLPAVTTVSGQSRSFSRDSGNLAYLATFTDGTTALYSVVFP
jgi:hypothetical protein